MVQHDSDQHRGEWDGAGKAATGGGAPARMVRLVAGAHLLTVNPVDGSEIEPCPPGSRPGPPRKLPAGQRPLPAAAAAGGGAPLLERDEERERLARRLARGRSIRLTGPSGVGRSTLLDAVAEDVGGLAPDGVVRLSGRNRGSADLLYELFAAVHDARGVRPQAAELRAALRKVGAVVIVDDLEFGGSGLDDVLDATPECAFLFAATPDVAAPAPGTHLQDFRLRGLSRTACMELLERSAGRPLTDSEIDWAADLWFAGDGRTEGLPLRFVQAGALLRHQTPGPRRSGGPAALPAAGAAGASGPGALGAVSATGLPGAESPYAAGGPGTPSGPGGPAGAGGPVGGQARGMAGLIADRLPEPVREALRFALALGGDLPHGGHLPALTDEPEAAEAPALLAAAGLVTAAGSGYRLAAGVAGDLTDSGYAEGLADRVLAAAQHYAWWVGHPSVPAERIAAEADALAAAIGAAQRAGHAEAALRLARATAPVLAATPHWGLWERVLRGGQSAARTAGEVAEEAYFHHELGVLALCTGRLERASTELEASIGLRGVLADQRGAVAGRRALALLTDLQAAADAERAAKRLGVLGTGAPGAPGTLAAPVSGGFPGPAPGAAPREQQAAGRPGGGDVAPTTPLTSAVPAAPGGRTDADDTGLGGRDGRDGRAADGGSGTETTAAAGAVQSAAVGGSRPAGAGGAHTAGRAAATHSRRRGLLARGARRNAVAAGAGAVLVAVLGTVVTLGNVSDSDDAPADHVKPGTSSAQPDETDSPTGDPTSEQPTPGASHSGRSDAPDPTTSSARPSDSATGSTPSDHPTTPHGSHSSPGGATHGGSATGGSHGGTSSGGSSGSGSGGSDSGGSTSGGSHGGTSSGGSSGSGSGGSATGGTGGSGGSTGGSPTGGGSDSGGTSDGGSGTGGTSDGGTSGGTSDGGTGASAGGSSSPSPSLTGPVG